MRKRTVVKWLHWLAFGLLLFFFVVDPDVPDKAGRVTNDNALWLHAGMGMLLLSVTIVWSSIYLRGGPLGRPGPKLPDWGRRVHQVVNTGLYWLVPLTVSSGGLAGLAATYPVRGFGLVTLNPTGWGTPQLHEIAKEVHEIAFNTTITMILCHLGFHVWRHLRLRDNALRIMFPRILHRYL